MLYHHFFKCYIGITKFIKFNCYTKTLVVKVFASGLQEQLVIHLLKFIVARHQSTHEQNLSNLDDITPLWM